MQGSAVANVCGVSDDDKDHLFFIYCILSLCCNYSLLTA
jgi:hypothetical protein